MNLDLKRVNALPVRTWSWLDINDININETITETAIYKKNYIKSGMQFVKQNTLHNACVINELHNEIKTGMGEEATQFVIEHKNCDFSLCIPKGIKVKEPIMLHYDLDEEDSTVIDLNHIVAEEDSEVTIIMNYQSTDKFTAFHSGLTYIRAEKNAVVNLIQIQMTNEHTIHLNNIGIVSKTESKVNLIQVELGAQKVMNGCMTNLIGNNSELVIDMIYFGNKNRSLDFNYIANHIGKMTRSELNINGALMDESSKKLRGTIDFKKGAIGAVGHEAEYNLLFSSKIKNITAPLILCGEDNVEGKHATNSGKIDENKLFYMMSRGIDEITAKKLMIDAWFQPIIDKIPNQNLQDSIVEYMKERLTYA